MLTGRSPEAGTVAAMTGWNFPEGDEIAPGLRAVRLLGGGKRYEAYLAWADHLRALVVVKVLRPSHVGDLEALQREAEMLRSLAHPMLLRAYGGQLGGTRPHLVLELIEGPRLSTLIRRYGMNIEQLLPLALNLCAVLHYLAHERVVHLDVKPRNIIMGAEPRLIDLSIARSLDDLAGLRAARRAAGGGPAAAGGGGPGVPGAAPRRSPDGRRARRRPRAARGRPPG